MKTLKINKNRPEPNKIRRAADIIKSGGIVVFPTETVYGIGASPFNKKAVSRIFKIKGRSGTKPLSLIVSSFDQVRTISKQLGPKVRALIKRSWPGPLTVVVKKSKVIPDHVTRGDKNIGIRMPDHKIALALIKAVGTPLVATSANISGMPPARSAEEAKKQLKNVDLLIDGEKSRLKTASTVVDFTKSRPVILRQGSLKVKI
jgi:L-threonylcarbamoyladenylate synthase